MFLREKEQAYEPLSSVSTESGEPREPSKPPKCRKWLIISFVLTFLASFAAGALSVFLLTPKHQVLHNVAPRIPIPIISKEFNFSTAFSQEPPQSDGETPEPIWDSLIPSTPPLYLYKSKLTSADGLGYFKDEALAPQTSIPTVFHQLHCLYILRRAYYSRSDELQRFDFGRNRTAHVAHCFDYLQQGLTCSVDTTVEPAVDHEHGFLGSGFNRQCRDYGKLKEFVESRRVFNATGFMAEGLDLLHQ
ncbi:hypothetical protein BDV25DRAFT_116453 [Aspergillus avenaceus]|uniref:Tat pathway signal sequence n=1 Tax=Aspergillus avenaceus TaxID=36643 RepID=A0A5N6U6Q6_ASPAV|nr:hypothetical protein BDV25DRAFT_116453 [Aspergillus avenaceus]